jgi:homoserine kinase
VLVADANVVVAAAGLLDVKVKPAKGLGASALVVVAVVVVVVGVVVVVTLIALSFNCKEKLQSEIEYSKKSIRNL